MEEAASVTGGGGSDGGEGFAAGVCEGLCDAGEVLGFIGMAAEGDWGEVRGIGFDEEAVCGDRFCEGAEGGGVWEGEDTAETDQETEAEQMFGEGLWACEAVEDAWGLVWGRG